MAITRSQETKQVEGKMGKQRGLYDNINRRKRLGISRSKSESTVSPTAYANMKAGFPEKLVRAEYGGSARKKMRNGGKMVKGPCS